MKPILLFGTQLTLSLVAYVLLSLWYLVPWLSSRPRDVALQPLVWVHAFRMIGGTVLAPGAVAVGVPLLFQKEIGYGDMITAFLALAALVALRARWSWAIPLVWLVVAVAADPRDARRAALTWLPGRPTHPLLGNRWGQG